MTLYELLHNVSFDELIPTLKGVYDVKDIYSYREAYAQRSRRTARRGDRTEP